jgi:superoxide dismutase
MRWMNPQALFGQDSIHSASTPTGHINHDIFWTNLAPEQVGGWRSNCGAASVVQVQALDCAAARPFSDPNPLESARLAQDCRPPTGELLKGIEAKWGGLDKFISTFNAKTAAVQVGGVGTYGQG